MNDQHFLYSTPRLGLRPLSMVEFEGSYPEWFLDEEVNKYNSHFRMPSGPDAIRHFVSGLATDKTRIVLAIYWLATHEHIGNISLQQIDHFNRSAELAFLLGEKAYWNQGIGQESGELLLQHGERYLALRRFTLGCLTENVGMKRLAEKLGFEREGLLKQALWHNGHFRDVALYGKNVTE